MDPLADQIQRLLALFEAEPGSPSGDPGRPGALRSLLAEHFDFERPLDRADLLGAAAAILRGTGVGGDHARHFGPLAAGERKASLAGAALDAGLGLMPAAWELAPAAIELQGLLLDHLIRTVGMDAERTVAHVCEAGAEAQLAALVAALTQCFPEFEAQGARGVDGQPRLYVSSAIADPWRKRALAVGLGRDAVSAVDCDAVGRIEPTALRKQVIADAKQGATPFFVVAGAGAAATGAIDPVKKLVAFARVQGMWLHVDGPGLGLGVYSPRLRAQLDGIGFSDSVALETRGGLPAAGSAGFFLCRHPRPVNHAFRVEDPRLPATTARAAEPRASGLFGARRAAALPFVLLLAEMGATAYGEALDRLVERADLLRRELEEVGCTLLAGSEVPVVCFLPPGAEREADVEAVAARCRSTGAAWVDAIRLPDGAPCLRAWIGSLRTGPADLRALAHAVVVSD